MKVFSYMKCQIGNHNKDYLIMMNDKGDYGACWGRIGGKTMGYSSVMTKAAAIAKKNSKLDGRSSSISGSVYTEHTTDELVVMKEAEKRFLDLVHNFGKGKYSKSLSPRWTSKNSFIPAVAPQVVYSKSTCPSQEELNVLRRLRQYIELSPRDNKVKQAVEEIKSAPNPVAACNILKERNLYRALADGEFFDSLVTMNFDFTTGSNPIKVFLRQLTPEILKKTHMNDKQVSMLRDMWDKKTYTLSQLYYLKYLFDFVTQASDLHSPFDVIEAVNVVSFKELNEEDVSKVSGSTLSVD